jgi:hypothetical protein
VSAV